jgi:hypothetical protein
LVLAQTVATVRALFQVVFHRLGGGLFSAASAILVFGALATCLFVSFVLLGSGGFDEERWCALGFG